MCLQKVKKYMRQNINFEKILHDYFNLQTFRQGQKEIIADVLAGKDVLGVLPTGSGKSLCYQLPARLFNGQTIVVSPLISLMVDQVKQLKANGFKRVVAINSFMSYEERRIVYNELVNYELIYVSPEILQQDHLLNRLKRLTIRLFVIDEAHCISQWGHEFRPDYLRLKNIIQQLNEPPVLALSATVTPQVEQDILKALNRPTMTKHIYPVDRKNIILTIKETANDLEKNNYLYYILKNYQMPTLIYFSSRQATEQVANFLHTKLSKHRVSFYHGGMDAIDRLHIQQQFMNDQLDIICCTSAFGMGINKEDIRLIIHYHLPSQIESFIQEIGRAGRDGKESVSLVLYQQNDMLIPKRLIQSELPTDEQITYVFQQLKRFYDLNKKLPTTDELIEKTFHCEITQWRFLFYQFEKGGMIKDNQIIYHPLKWRKAFQHIKTFKTERLHNKQQQLQEMFQWIHTNGCLRQSLYRKYLTLQNENLNNCCQACGFNIETWQPFVKKTVKSKSQSWQQRLKNMLFVEELHESKKIN